MDREALADAWYLWVGVSILSLSLAAKPSLGNSIGWTTMTPATNSL